MRMWAGFLLLLLATGCGPGKEDSPEGPPPSEGLQNEPSVLPPRLIEEIAPWKATGNFLGWNTSGHIVLSQEKSITTIDPATGKGTRYLIENQEFKSPVLQRKGSLILSKPIVSTLDKESGFYRGTYSLYDFLKNKVVGKIYAGEKGVLSPDGMAFAALKKADFPSVFSIIDVVTENEIGEVTLKKEELFLIGPGGKYALIQKAKNKGFHLMETASGTIVAKLDDFTYEDFYLQETTREGYFAIGKTRFGMQTKILNTKGDLLCATPNGASAIQNFAISKNGKRIATYSPKTDEIVVYATLQSRLAARGKMPRKLENWRNVWEERQLLFSEDGKVVYISHSDLNGIARFHLEERKITLPK